MGQAKVDSAAQAIVCINPHVSVETHLLRLNDENAQALIARYDVVVDGSDNFSTRYVLADAAQVAKRPLVTAAIGRFDGTLTVLKPYETNDDGVPNPSYRDLFPEAPPPGAVPSCAEAGVLGALPGVMGSLEAMEVIKLIAGIGEPLVGRLLLYNALTVRFETIHYKARKSK